MALIRRQNGQRAAATAHKGLALWTQEGPGAHKWPSRWYILYIADVLPWAWNNAHPKGWVGPGMQVMLAEAEGVGASAKGIILLQRREKFRAATNVPSASDWEATEIAAVEGYGPMLWNLALADVAPHGVFPDQSTVSPQAKRMMAATKKAGRYDLTTFSHVARSSNRTLSSVYHLKPAELKAEKRKLAKLKKAHREAVEQVNWADLKHPGLTRENLDDWLRAAHAEWFRMRYHGTGRGRGRN